MKKETFHTHGFSPAPLVLYLRQTSELAARLALRFLGTPSVPTHSGSGEAAAARSSLGTSLVFLGTPSLCTVKLKRVAEAGPVHATHPICRGRVAGLARRPTDLRVGGRHSNQHLPGGSQGDAGPGQTARPPGGRRRRLRHQRDQDEVR